MKKFSIAVAVLLLLPYFGCSSPTDPNAGNNNKTHLSFPETIDFGNVRDGLVRDSLVRLTNTGTDTLSITAQTFSSSAFSLVDSTSSHLKIAPGGYKDVWFRFAPTSVATFDATDSIRSSSSAVNVLKLHGVGIARTRSLNIPRTFDFGNSPYGGCHDSTLSFVNTGNDTLIIYSASVESNAVFIDSAISEVAPGATGKFYLRFCPEGIGSVTTTFTIQSNATGADSTFIVTLFGNGVSYHPAQGSSYTYLKVDLDSTARPVPGSQRQIATSIAATGLDYAGLTNVTQLQEPNRFVYYRIEDNGNVRYYIDGLPTTDSLHLFGSGWVNLPFATHETNLKLFGGDTDFTTQQTAVHLHLDQYVSYLGDTTFAIAGKQLHASHVQLTETATYTATAGTMYVVLVYHVYFAPEIGAAVAQIAYVVQTKQSGTTEVHSSGGEARVLTSYSLK